jgi:hypothetical protein
MSGGQEILTSSRGSAAVRSRWERDCLAVFEAIVRRVVDGLMKWE